VSELQHQLKLGKTKRQTGWKDDRMVRMNIGQGRMARWQDGKMARWQDKQDLKITG